MQMLVLYSTTEGHTAKIAKRVAEALENTGHEVFLTATGDPGYCDPGTFDAAILCAPIHMGRYPADFVEFVSNWNTALSSVPNALITSSLLIASSDKDDEKEATSYPAKLTSKTGWEPGQIYNVAGSLNYPVYDFFKCWVMKRAAKSENWSTDTNIEHVFTDWDELDTFTNEFARAVQGQVA